MRRKLIIVDLLCGAGGSSTGCIQALLALGWSMDDIILACLNHSPIAIDTHTRNHPHARHYCQDIATARPHQVVPEGYVDLMMASPTCTHHSNARGGKPTSDQQRSDPWHIITWMTELRVRCLIIENVWEFLSWGPVDHRTGKPIQSRKGEYFRAWIDTIRRLGFDPEWRKLNAADYGDATTRQRFILMARSDGKSISWPTPTHLRRTEGSLDLFPGMKSWRPARDIIDWDIKGRSIFNRKKPLAPKTLARIYAGAVKFKWPEPFLILLRKHMEVAAGLRPAPATPYIQELEVAGLVQPGTLEWEATKPLDPAIITLRNHMAGQSVDGPLPTIAANGTHIGLAEPVIMNGRKGNQAKGVSTAPIPTLDTKGGVWLAEPFIMAPGSYGAPRGAAEPLPTITTGGAGAAEREGCARPMLVEPFILNRHGDNGSPRAHSTGEPAPTADCRGAGYLVEPFVLSQASGGAPRAGTEPLPTMATGGAIALISPYYGTGSGETCNSADEPLPTITSKGRFGMVVPVTNGSGGPVARNIDDPVPTMTTAKGGEFAIVMPVTHAGGVNRSQDAGEPLPTVTGANRGELAFITAQFGEREGQAPRVHDIGNPAPAICATGHVNLIEATPQYDILFRMLEPHELAAAMGFNSDEVEYEFAGTKTEKIKQIGNAVSVAKMKACVSAIMADAAPAAKAKPKTTQAVGDAA